MSKSRLLSEAGFLLAISLLLLVNQGFVAVQVIFLLIAIFFTGVSYLLPRKASWFFSSYSIASMYFLARACPLSACNDAGDRS